MPDFLPPGAYAEECFEDVLPDAFLPDEVAVISAATVARRREFHTVRTLARRALMRLTPEAHRRIKGHPLLPDERGAPIWPPGIVGSMTHTQGYRAAVVARSSSYAAIGLDAELNRTLPAEVCGIICRPEERSMIDVLTRQEPSLPWCCVLFSAKESVYKAWYPLTRAWLDFDDVSVQIELGRQTFRARLPAHTNPGQARTVEDLQGRWLATADLILTTAYLPSGSG